jgi:hypothetical protein
VTFPLLSDEVAATLARSTCEDNIEMDLKYFFFGRNLFSFSSGCRIVLGCCEDCDEPSGTLQDTVSFSELNEYLVSLLGQSWSGSVRRSVTEMCSRNVFSMIR